MDNLGDTGIFLAERARNRVLFLPDSGDPACVVLDHGLNDPYGLTLTPDGRLIIADKMHHRLLVVDEDIRLVKTHDVANHRKTPFARKRDFPWCPTSVWIEPASTWLVSYSEDHAIYRIQTDGALELVVGIHAGQHIRYSGCREHVPPAEVHQVALQQPTSVVQMADGSVVFIERRFQCIRQFHPERGSTSVFPVGNQEAWEYHRVKARDLPEIMPVASYHPTYPTAITVSSDDTLIIADGAQQCVWELRGKSLHCIYRSRGEGRGGPSGLTWTKNNMLWVFDSSESSVVGLRRENYGCWSRVVNLTGDIAIVSRGPEGTGLTWGMIPSCVKKRLSEYTSATRI
jgi:hypothetical protein